MLLLTMTAEKLVLLINNDNNSNDNNVNPTKYKNGPYYINIIYHFYVGLLYLLKCINNTSYSCLDQLPLAFACAIE